MLNYNHMNIEQLIAKSIDQHMHSVYSKILKNNVIGEDGTPLTIESYQNVIKYFENLEEYEMCAKLLKKQKERFDHEINFNKLPKTLTQ